MFGVGAFDENAKDFITLNCFILLFYVLMGVSFLL